MSEYQSELLSSKTESTEFDLNAALRVANEQRSRYVAEGLGKLWAYGRSLFSRRVKAVKQYYRLQHEIANVDHRILGDVGVSRWELMGLVRNAIGSRADTMSPSGSNKRAAILPLFSLMRAEAVRKERDNSDHPMAA